MSGIYEGGFFDNHYTDYDLPEDYFDSSVEGRIKHDPTLISFNEGMYFDPDGTTSFGDYDYAHGEFNVGPKDVTQPTYYIGADYVPAEQVLNWYLACQEKGTLLFPDLPVAKIDVSENKYEKRIKKFPLEDKLTRCGFHLFEPTYSTMVDMAGQSRSFAREVKWSGHEEYKIDLDLYLFEQFKDTLKKDYTGKYISMQFNPFHPFSIHKILDMEWEGNVVKGNYKDQNRVRPFEYDLEDVRYRLHSDQWMPQFECIQHYAVFDLVSNFDFREELLSRVSVVTMEPLVIEPISTNRNPDPGYSVIGPWDGFIKRGVGDVTFSPYATYPFDLSGKKDSVSFYEISDFCSFVEGNMLSVDLDTIRRDHVIKKRYEINLKPRLFPLNNGLIDDEYIYIKYNKKKPEFFRVFIQNNRLVELVRGKLRSKVKKRLKKTELDEPGGRLDGAYHQKFVVVKGMVYSAFPRNKYGSIIYDYRCITLYEAVKMNEEHEWFHEFITISSPIFPRKVSSWVYKVEDMGWDIGFED